MGDRELRLVGDDPLPIVDAELVDADGVSLLGVGLRPVSTPDGEWIGRRASEHRWPPRGWSDHVDAVGATIALGEEWNIAVGLLAEASRASADGLLITYEDARGRRGEARHPTRLRIAPTCSTAEPAT